MTSSRADQRREATEAFRRYAAHGERADRDEMLSTEAWQSDTDVSKTLSVLTAEGKEYVVEAVREVYFVEPCQPLKKNDIEMRITRYCMTKCVSRSAVYEHLAIARKIFWAIAHHKG